MGIQKLVGEEDFRVGGKVEVPVRVRADESLSYERLGREALEWCGLVPLTDPALLG